MSTGTIEAASQVHLLALRKALSNRNAAVMVGAGFSRNAVGGENLATWRQLSEALSMELEPGRPSGNFSPAAAAQLAEQYSRVFSPTHLEQLIKRCVPDDQVTPGPLHKSLLELPWSEVFTTNYDTLLERTAERMFEVSYFTVCSREDIPQSKVLGRRRIVKLHGSLPSSRPFILTEEDYRTYPFRFAPFVNLVRQSLLENVFCLIGFSGDDPNFLHWLGWVRDMLDKHALPVYLFLAEAPTLGESKLYEARGVVPVLLPVPVDVPRSDFHARYRALFDELKKPLSDSPLDWGSLPLLGQEPISAEREDALDALLPHLAVLSARRSTYPGWIVAPHIVRDRLWQSCAMQVRELESKKLHEQLAERSPIVVLWIVDLYCWAMQVTLRPILDDVAQLGLLALNKAGSVELENFAADLRAFLSNLGIQSPASHQKIRTDTAIALLTWARQAHRSPEYESLRQRLLGDAALDSAVQDRLVYEDALRCLQAGDRHAALQLVLKWRPKGPDAYMHVLRGSLLAETGEPFAAMPVLEQAVETLRRQQRSKPEDPELISKEAWACIVAHHVQQAVNFSLLIRADAPRSEPSVDEEPRESQDFDSRLTALTARGYSAREELDFAMSRLKAEAPLPAPERLRLAAFNLGSASTRSVLGLPSELREKISASFQWLELMERIGLLAHTRNARFYDNEMLQAAWWTRFADRPERSIGLLLRASRQEALKPSDPARPAHLTGWLGRRDVAEIREDAASELSLLLVHQVELEFDGSRPGSSSGSRAAFLLDVLGRLVVRVRNNSLLDDLARRLLAVHRSNTFQSAPTVWALTSEAIGRVLEALPDKAQQALLLEAFRLPLLPLGEARGRAHAHQVENWLDPRALFRHYSNTGASKVDPGWRPIVDELISRLSHADEALTAALVWRRLGFLRDAALIVDSEKEQIGKALWDHAAPNEWPRIPNQRSIGTLLWPRPQGNAAPRLLDHFLAEELRPFSSGYMQLTTPRKGRTYHIGGADDLLGQISFTLAKTQPTMSQIERLVEMTDEWIDADCDDLLADIDDSHIHDSVSRIATLLDEILARCARQLSEQKRTVRIDGAIGMICAMDQRLRSFPVERFKLRIELVKSGDLSKEVLGATIRSVIGALIDTDDTVATQGFRSAFALMVDDHRALRKVGQSVFNAVVACTLSQRESCLSEALNVLGCLPASTWRWYLNEGALLLLDAALKAISQEFAYGETLVDARGPAVDVPTVRFHAFRLAHTLVHVAKVHSAEAHRWLKLAESDPLPEIRLGRFKVVTG